MFSLKLAAGTFRRRLVPIIFVSILPSLAHEAEKSYFGFLEYTYNGSPLQSSGNDDTDIQEFVSRHLAPYIPD